MADWQTVRYDPTYEEKIDPEILNLCDVLNEVGFETTGSCCGHGFAWPYVYMSGNVWDVRYEGLARFLFKKCGWLCAQDDGSVAEALGDSLLWFDLDHPDGRGRSDCLV